MKRRAAFTMLAGALAAAMLCSCGPDDFPEQGAGTAASTEVSSEAGYQSGLEESAVPDYQSSSEEDTEANRQYVPEKNFDEAMVQSLQEALSRDPFDQTVSSPFCSGHLNLLDILVNDGHMPDEFWWINEDLFRATFPIYQYLSAGCGEFVLNFETFIDSAMVDVPGEYGLTQEEWEYGEMKAWPWRRWTEISKQFDMYVTLYPQEQPPTVTLWTPPEGLTGIGEPNPDSFSTLIAGPFDEDGNLLPTPEPTPFPTDRQPVEEYQPPEWNPVPEHDGYEMAIVAETGDGLPLAVCLRWQREGHWFLCQIPGHCLEDFWRVADELWVKLELEDCQELLEQEPQRGID